MLPLPGFLQELALEVGQETALALGRKFAGQIKSFPRRSSITRWKRNQAIANDFDGFNAGELALKYKLSIFQISRILKRAKKTKSQGLS